ncbi:PspC domain-containing protein [Actinomyces timonensis]|uniref:PspC domain-containing protein n=1 Tax=Actinomyces timonensis TaxID=1288391 RepID=A0AAU8N558_9ACTO
MSTTDYSSTSETTTSGPAYDPGDQHSGPCSTGFGGATYAQGSFSAHTESWRSSLPHRSRKRLLAGVCGGIAEDMGVSPTLVRLATLALALLPGPMWLAYAIAWVLMPAAD